MILSDASTPPPRALTLSAADVALLAELLTDVDEFLRSSAGVFTELRAFAAQPGRPDAGYLIDAVSFNAAHLRRLLAAPGDDAEAVEDDT
jgi:hypothetical protein